MKIEERNNLVVILENNDLENSIKFIKSVLKSNKFVIKSTLNKGEYFITTNKFYLYVVNNINTMLFKANENDVHYSKVNKEEYLIYNNL